MQPTDIRNPDYFHRVVDCQWACPAHTPVPEYTGLIAAGRYADTYLVNWKSNVFPAIPGRTCDRPCEPACRRGRVEAQQLPRPEPVAICRLKRVAADFKGDVRGRLPKRAKRSNGKRIACVGAGPASLTVARDLAPLGYQVTLFDQDAKAGGIIRSQIPRFRLPEQLIDEETGYILDLGVDFRSGVRIECRNVNDRMFGHNDNKQAFIQDIDARGHRQLVEAPEACQVTIIHPGKPRNPNEPGLAELLEHAKPFL